LGEAFEKQATSIMGEAARILQRILSDFVCIVMLMAMSEIVVAKPHNGWASAARHQHN
jgi:hypothetical protein